MRLIPWISLLIAAVVALGPPGQETIRGLSSGELLARSMSQLVIMIAAAALALLTLVEFALRIYFKRRATRAE